MTLLHNVTTRRVLPVGSLLVAAWLGLAVLNATLLAAGESSGLLCQDDGGAQRGPDGHVVFDTRSLCHPLGRRVSVGATYRMRVVIERRDREPAARSWLDGGIPASPNGIDPGAVGGLTHLGMYLAVPFRRQIEEPWFKLMVRIGERGADGISPRWQLVESNEVADVYVAEFVSSRTGPVFVYVNDAVPIVWPRWFLGNNTGFARIELREIARARPPLIP